MAKTLGFTELRNPPLSSVSAGPGDGQRAANPCRRFGRGVGFWLGAVLLGLGGGILGGWMPYQHPVAVACGVLWWGIYFGCFGASLGALVGLWAEQTFPPPSEEEKGSRPPLLFPPPTAGFPVWGGEGDLRPGPVERSGDRFTTDACG